MHLLAFGGCGCIDYTRGRCRYWMYFGLSRTSSDSIQDHVDGGGGYIFFQMIRLPCVAYTNSSLLWGCFAATLWCASSHYWFLCDTKRFLHHTFNCDVPGDLFTTMVDNTIIIIIIIITILFIIRSNGNTLIDTCNYHRLCHDQICSGRTCNTTGVCRRRTQFGGCTSRGSSGAETRLLPQPRWAKFAKLKKTKKYASRV